MTEYGRGQGSEAWHPQDPLYGDPTWDTAHDRTPTGGTWDPYADGASNYSYQQPHPQEYPPPLPQQGWPGNPHVDQSGWGAGAGAHQPYGYGSPGEHQGGWGAGAGAHQSYGYGSPAEHQGGWDGWYGGSGHPSHGGGYDSGYGGGYDQYGGGYGGGAPAYGAYGDYVPPGYGYGDPSGSDPGQWPASEHGYPSAGPRQQSREPGQPDRPESGADPETGWDPGPDQGEHDFFHSSDDDRDSDRGGGGEDGRPRKRRSGCACFGAAVLLVGLLGVGGYFGKQFYDSRFGAPEDYAGEGTGEEVQVKIPEGATLVEMGNVLHEAGVVASVDAFTDAADGEKIQPGYYTLYAEMSAESAVQYLTDPEMLNALVIPEGLRATAVYETIDSRLELEEGTTEEIASSGDIELPEWAESDDPDVKDPLEGFLLPARYDIGDEADPADLLQAMVDRADARYSELGVEEAVDDLGHLDEPRDIITVASLVQAEGITYEDFQAMAEVVYNRIGPDNEMTNGKVEFDSTYNYLQGQSEIVISEEEVHNEDDPYNTYYHEGLTPGPINNPGDSAVKAALDPTNEGWMFFISLDGETTTFTETLEEHQELREEFNERQDISGTG